MLSSAQRRLLLLTATFALSLLSCGREVTGPENGINYGRARFGAVSLDPQMPSLLASLEGASDVVPFERVRVVLRRDDGTITVDTIVDFPVGADSIALSLLVPLPIDTPEEGLPLSLTMAYMNAAGDTVFRGGPVNVIAPPIGSSASQQPIIIPVVYDGIGKDAARVAISPDTGTRVAGTSSTFSATAFDGANAPIANTPLIFYTLDSTRATVANAGSGQVTWLANRGVARIVAALPNGLRADTAFVTVSLPASKLVVQSGNAQSGIVSTALGQPLVLRTLASDDVPVSGVIVTFAVTTGGGALSVVTDTSDANGEVSTAWTLGAALGTQTITATAPGLTGSPLSLTATATPGTPAQVVFTQSATAAAAGATLTPPVLVAVQDIAGNLVTTFTGPVGLELTAGSSGPINGTTTVNAIGGIATFADLSFDLVGTYNLTAVLDSTARDTSAVITVTPGAGAVLEFVEQPIGAVAGVAFAPPVTVVTKDAKGNIATDFTGTITLSLLNANGATLGGSLSVPAVNGLATFTGITVDKVGTSYALAATSGTLTADTSATFGIVPAQPAAIVLIAGDGQTGPASTTLPSGIVVEVRDAFLNPIPGVTVNFNILVGSGSSSSASAVTDLLGRAATTWTLGPVVGSQVLRASVPANPLATVDINATATVGAPAVIVFTQSPAAQQVAGQAFTPEVVVEVRDISGNVVTNYTGSVVLAIDNNPSGASLLGTLAVNAVSGVATFPGVSIELAGVGYTLRATTDTLPAVISSPFDIVNGTPSIIVPVSGDGQSGTVGTLLADSLVVRVTDQFGNKVEGIAVTFAEAVGLGSVAPTTVITNALGEAATSWTLGGSFGPQAVNAVILDGAAIYTFSATATVAAPAILTIESGDAQVAVAGSPFPGPVRVLVTDAFGNRVAGAQVAWSGFGVIVAADTTLTDGNGVAEVIATAPPEVGGAAVTATLVAAPSQFVVFSVTVEAAAPATPILESQPTSATAGTAINPFTVRVEDAFGNLATSFNGPVTLTAELINGTPVSVIVAGDSVDAVNGLAEFAATRIDVLGTYRLIADLGALGTVVSDPFTVSAANPSQLLLVDGDAQSAEVAATLAAPLRVRVTDDFGNGVSGISVNWGVISGLAAFTDTVTVTDTNGVALTSVILGSESGTISIGAFAAGLTGSPVTFTASATAGAAFGIVTVSGDAQTAAAGAAFAQPFVVRVVDAFGNGVSGVDVTFESVDGVSAFGDTVVTSDASGLASTTAIAAQTAGSALITANAPGVSPTSFGVTISAGVATELFYQSIPPVGTAGVVYDPIVIAVRDAFGNVVTGFSDSMTISIRIGANGATLAGTVTRAPVAGIFTFDDLVFTTLSSYQLEVVAGPLTQASPGIQVNAAAAAAIAAEGLPERTVAATAVAPPLFAKVTDAFGNPVAGETVTWTVASGDITLSAATSITDALGVATVEATAGPTVGIATATASSGTLVGSPVAFPITITNGPGSQLTLEIGPAETVAGDILAPFTVAVRDVNGNVAVDFVGDVTIVVDSGPSNTIGGVATVAVSAGAATFDQVSLETAGQYRLRFSAPGVSDAVSALFNVLPGAAATIALLDGDAQSDTVALALDLPLRVRVLDAFGNGVAGQAIAWSPIGSGAVSQDTTLTDASGIAQVTFTLSTVSGGTSLQAAVDGLSGSPVVFTATGIPGEVAALVVTNQPDTVSAIGVGAPITVEARDQYANLVTWFVGDVNLVINDAPAGNFAAGTTTRAAVGGIATFDDLEYGASGSWFVDFISGAFSTGTSIEVVAGAPNSVTIFSGDNQSGTVTLPLPLPLQVIVRDANNNPVVGDTVVFSVTQGGGTLSSLTAVDTAITNIAGVAQTNWTLGSDSTISHFVQVNRAGFATLTFTATPLAFVANRTWTGDADTDPLNAANWQGGLLPVSTDSVLVPAGRPNYPVLTATQEMARLTVQSGATIELGQWSILVNGSLSVLGSAQITSNDSGTVVLQGASGGTVRGAVPQLFVSAGNYAAIGGITTVFDLGVTGSGALDFGTSSSSIGRDLIVTGSGAINMTGAPTLVVERDVIYTSSTLTSGLTSGVLRVRGNVSANGSFRPSASHTTNLDGTGVQTVTFSSADETYTTACTAGCFGTLESNKASGGLIFASGVKALGAITISGDTLGASGRTIIGVGGTSLQSAVTTAGSVGYTSSLQIGSLFSADTLVAFGGDGTTPLAAIGVIPSRVIGAYALSTNHPGSVTINGVLDVDGPNARIGDNLFTAGTGRLRMTDATDSLSVGLAVFGGITDSTFLTAGVLDVRVNFEQNGAGITSYAAQAGHRLRMSAATSTITSADPLLNPLGSLHVSDGSALTVAGLGVRINGAAVLEGATATATGAGAEALIFGGLVDAVGNRWSVQTTRFQAANPVLPLAINSDVIFANAVSLGDSLTVTGGVRVTTADGLLTLNGRTLRTAQFTTDDLGRLDMSAANDSLFVTGVAAFEGGSSILTDGYLEVGGNFVQSVTGDAFAAAAAHETWLTGGSSIAINFANGGLGAGQSHFGTLGMNKGVSAGVDLLSDVFVDGLWQITPTSFAAINGDGGQRALTTRGAAVQDVAFTNVRWELLDGAPAAAPISNVSFGVIAPDVVQFRVARASGTITLVGTTFATAPTTGFYIEAEDTNTGDASALTVSVSSVQPAFHNGRINLLAGAQLLGWDAFAALNWTNADGDRNWFNTNNWAEGVIPSASDSVVITGIAPVIGAGNNAAARSLIMTSTQEMLLDGTLTISRRLNVGLATSGIFCNTGTGQLLLAGAGDSVAFQGEVRCDVRATLGDVALSGFTQLDSLAVESGASVTVNGANLTTNILRTQGTGRLVMANALDSVLVFNEAEFSGASTLTAGRLRIYGSFAQTGNPTAFQATAAHTTEFIGVLQQSLSFANPDSSAAGSHFGTFQLSQGAPGIAIALGSPVFANGPLLAIPAVDAQRRALSASTTQTVVSRGADVSLDLELDNVLWRIVEGGTLAPTLSSVRFLNQPEGITQLSIARDGGNVQFIGFEFDSLPTATTYLEVIDSDAGAGGSFTVDMLNPTPTFHGGRVSVDINAILTNWAETPSFVWTGAINDSWNIAGNWSDNLVPNASSVVTIPDVSTTPVTGTPVSVRQLNLTGLSTALSLGDTLFITEALHTDFSSAVSCVALGRVRFVPTDSATVRGTIACPVDILSGTVAQNGNTSVTGAMTVDSVGRLAIREHDLVLQTGSSFATAGSGTFEVSDVSGSLTVNGASTFAGGATTGLLTTGQIIFAGDVTQGGGDPAALDIGASVGTIFSPTASALVSFANPASSGLGNTVLTSGTLSILDTTNVRGPFNVQAGTVDGEQGRLNVNGDLTGNGALIVKTASFTGNWARTGGLQPDTVIFAGVDQVLASTYSGPVIEWQTVVIEGTAFATTSGAVADTLKIGQSLIVRGAGARLTFDNTDTPGDSLLATVFSSLRTLNGGTFAMNEPGVSVTVGANGDFQGGDQTGLLTEGRLALQAGMNNTVANAFLATGQHTTAVGACGFCDGIPLNLTGGNARFGSLVMENTSNATISASIEADTVRMVGGNVGFPNAGSTLRVNNSLTSNTTPTLTVTRLSLGEGLAFDGGWGVDTLIMTGTGHTLPAKDNSGDEIPYNAVVIEGSIATIMANGDSLTILGGVTVRGNGELRFNDSVDGDIIRMGSLRTEGNGIIRMLDANTTVRVFGPAIFAGGSTDTALDAGTIEFYGDFTQLATTSAASYRANPNHVSRFVIGENDPVVSFATPGSAAGNSAFGAWNPLFGTLKFINLATDVFTLGQFQQTSTTPIEIRSTDTPKRIFASGADIRDITFRAVSMQIEATAVPLNTAMLGLNFEDQDPDVIQLSITRFGDDGVLQLENPVFNTVPASGLYLSLSDNVSDANVLTMNVVSPAPGFHAGLVQTLGGAVLTGWPTNGPGIWTGASGTDFGTPSNWQSGIVPFPGDSIYIDDSAFNTLSITSPVTVGAIHILGGQIDLQDTLTVTGTASLGGGSAFCGPTGAVRVAYAGPDSVAFSMNTLECNVFVSEGRVYLDQNVNVVNLSIENTGILNVNGRALTTSGNLGTTQAALLVMADNADTVRIGGQAIFQGGDETGQLNAGAMVVQGSLLQGGTATAFATSGTLHVFLGDSTNIGLPQFAIQLNNPETSPINRLTIFDNREAVVPVNVTGELRMANGSALTGLATTVLGGFRLEGFTSSLTVDRLAVAGALFIEGAFTPDSVDFLGAGTAIQEIPAVTVNEDQFTYGVLRVLADSARMRSPFPYQINSRLEVNGNGRLEIGDPLSPAIAVSVLADSADLAVAGDGRLNQLSDGQLRVRSATFGGGDHAGMLVRGDLIVHEGFTQSQNGPITQTFIGADLHRVIFDGANTITMANPTLARFRSVQLEGAAEKLLGSDIVVDSTIGRPSDPATNITVRAPTLGTTAPTRITVRGGTFFGDGDGTRVTFRNVALRLEGDANNGSEGYFLSDITFQEMEPTATFLDVAALNYTIEPRRVEFNSAVTTGRYFEIADASTTMNFLSSLPVVGCINVPEGCVGPRFEPTLAESRTWTGAVDNSWTNGLNWDAGTPPPSWSDVVIPQTAQNPLLSGNQTVRNLTVATNAEVVLDNAVLTVTGTSLDVAGQIVESGLSLVSIRPANAPVTISGGGLLQPSLIIDEPTAGPETTVTLTAPLTIGAFDRRLDVRANTLVLNGYAVQVDSFSTALTGRLQMTNPLDSLKAISVRFEGGSTAGLLTDGVMLVSWNFVQGGANPTAFAASGNHLTAVVGGGRPQNFTFQNPGPSDSHFGNLLVQGSVPADTMKLGSDVYVNGLLQMPTSRRIAANPVASTNRLLSSLGFSNAGGFSSFINVRLSTQTSAGINFSASMFFSDMPTDVTQLAIEGPGGLVTIGAVTFTGLNPGDLGKYLSVTDNLANGDSLRVNIPFRSPEGNGGFVQTAGEGLILNWDQFALYTFTGTSSTSFGDAANWDVGSVPTSTSNVLVANGGANPLVITSPVTIKRMTTTDNSVLTVQDTLYTTGVLGGFDVVSGTTTCAGNGAFVVNDPSAGPTFLRANIPSCDVILRQGNVNLGIGSGADTTNVRDLRLEGGFFGVGKTVRVAGNFSMIGNAILFSGGSADSLIVQGDASFRGQQAYLTDGNFLVLGDLDVGASGALQFRMESPAHLALGDPGQSGGIRSISIDAGSEMYVDSLTIFDGSTTVSGTMRVRRHLAQATISGNVLTGGTIEIGDPTNEIVGTMTSGDGGELTVDRLVVYGGFPAGGIPNDGIFSPDTTDFVGTAPTDNGGVQRIRAANAQETAHDYQLVRVFADAVMEQIPTGIPFAYSIETGLQVLNGQLTIGNAIDTAYVDMPNADIIVSGPNAGLNMTGLSRITADSVHFQGGLTSQLNEGRLIARSLVAAQASAMVAVDPHVLDMYGTGWLSMNDYDNNPLHTVRLTGGAVTSLNTYLRIDGSLGRVADGDGLVTLRAGTIPGFAQFIVTPSTNFSPSNSGLLLRNVALSLQAFYPEPGGSAILNNVTFEDMDPATIFLQALWSGVSTATWNNINFNSPVAAGGRYFEFATGDAGSEITFTNATPAVGCLATVCVPTNFSPIIEAGATWLGLSSSAWTNPANWSTATVPTAGTDVIIGSGGNFGPVISANTGVRSLTVNAGATLALDVDDTLSVYDALTVDGTVTGASLNSTLRLIPPVDTFDLSATGAIQSKLAIGSGIGGYDGVVQLIDRVNLTATGFSSGVFLNAGLLDLNGNTLQTSSNFQTFGSARFKMTNPLDTLLVGESFRTFGGSTAGLLTEGEIVLTGTLFRQYDDNSTESFVASGNHSMRFAGGDRVLDVWFESPDSTLSRFANLAIDRVFDQWVLFDYSRVFVTNLTKVSGRIEVYNDGFGVGLGSDGELIVSGAVSDVDPNHMFDMIFFGKVQLLAVDPGTCNGLAFNVQYKMAGFEPIACHSAEYAWSAETGTAAVTSYGAYAASDTDIWVVGANGTIQRGDGTGWTTETSNTSSTLFAVHGTSATDVWAVGAGGAIVHWDGTSWTESFQGIQNLNGVFASNINLAYAVGDGGTILRWDGSVWSSMTSGTAVKLTGIYSAGLFADDLLATGEGGTILRLVSGSWQPLASGVATNLTATYASTATGYLVFGENGTIRQRGNPFAQLFDALSPTSENLNGAGGNGTAGFVVGANGTVLRFLGESFVPQNSLTTVELHGVAVTPNGTAYVVGADGVVQKGVIAP